MNDVHKVKGSVGRRAGRPPGTSRDAILTAALTLLKQSGNALSIRNLAAELGTAPAAIYNYFANKEVLLDALAERAFRDLGVAQRSHGAWPQQLRCWMQAFHDALIAAPELMQLISLTFASPSFLTYVQQLRELIAKSGLDERRCVLYAQGLLWTAIAFALNETQSRTPKIKRRLQAVASKSPDPGIARHLATIQFGDLWSTTVEREIAGIVHLVNCAGIE